MAKVAKHVLLGFEVGAGAPVEIPVRHMVVCGQTQEAGKTTTLEALIERSGLRALSFVTKRGEGAFAGGRVIAPYFREQADWRFVSSLLEAFLHERLKFERSWIMRATKGARTLADVRKNITRLQVKAKGLSADVYMVLGEYLDELVPTIALVQWAPKVDLDAGVNVMNLAGIPESMQHLVIKSAIDWCQQHEADVVVVVPEAWKFIPQGRNTPVRLSAMSYIRQGASIRNYLWLDSQDIGGVDKELLRSCPVWLLGVQREANEIKRTLSNIHGIAKPKAEDVATLELGQFFVCWGRHAVKTYVQPAWMEAPVAACVARGEWSVVEAARTSQQLANAGVVSRLFQQALKAPKEQTVNETEAQTLREENERLKTINADLTRRIEALEHGIREGPDYGDRRVGRRGADLHGGSGAEPGARASHTAAGSSANETAAISQMDRRVRTATQPMGEEHEALYQAFKSRLIEELPKDPRVMEIVLAQPELRVKVQRQVLEVDGDTLRGRIGRLIADGFFDGDAQTTGSVLAELQKRGFSTAPPNVSKELSELTRMGFFTRDNKWYRVVPEMKVNVVEAA